MSDTKNTKNKYYPNQRVSESTKKTREWYVPTIQYWINRAINSNDKQRVKDDMMCANGEIPDDVFDYITKPLSRENIEDSQYDKLPGEIRKTDFLTPIKEKHLGEYIELPYVYHVTIDNPMITLERDVSLRKLKTKLIDQAIVNILNKNMDTGVPTLGEDVDVKSEVEEFIDRWVKEKGIKAKKTLKFLNHLTDFELRRITCFFHYWSTEQFYTHRYIQGEDLYVDVIDPTNGYPVDDGEDYVEDMKGFLIRDYITYNELIDLYRNDISKEDREYLESFTMQKTFNGSISVSAEFIDAYRREDFYARDKVFDSEPSFGTLNEIERNVIYFTAEKEVKVLTFEDEFGEEHERTVDKDYKLDESIGDKSITTDWINTVYYAVRLGPDDIGIYIKPKEHDVQRRDMNNPSICKIPIGGKTRMLRGNTPNPIPRRVIPYQTLYRIITLQMERTIAKYKGDIEVIPKSMLYDSELKPKDVIWYKMADNSLIFDDSKIDLQTAVQGYRIVGNRGLGDYIKALLEIRANLKEEAWEVAHMNDSRYGNINPRAGKGVTEHNIFRAKLGSYLLIYTFNMAMERDHAADLEFSKFAWINGKKGSYKDSNTVEDIDIDGATHLNNDYGVFIMDSMIEDKKLSEFKELAFAASQNGNFDLAAKAITTDSTHEIDVHIDKFIEAQREFAEAQTTKQSEAEMAKDQQKHQFDLELVSAKGEVDAQIEIVKGQIDLTKLAAESSLKPETDNREEVALKQSAEYAKTAMDTIKLDLERRKQSHKEADDNEKNKLKAKDIDTKLKIARENKNKYD